MRLAVDLSSSHWCASLPHPQICFELKPAGDSCSQLAGCRTSRPCAAVTAAPSRRALKLATPPQLVPAAAHKCAACAQVQQDTKSGRFACPVCGTKQSRQRVGPAAARAPTRQARRHRADVCAQAYAQGAAKDVRLAVQSLNSARASAPGPYRDALGSEESPQPAAPKGSWASFVSQPQPASSHEPAPGSNLGAGSRQAALPPHQEPPGSLQDNYVTEVPGDRLQPHRRGKRTRLDTGALPGAGMPCRVQHDTVLSDAVCASSRCSGAQS